MDDWQAIAAILTALAAVGAAWATWGRDRAKGQTDHATLTLDGVFRLVNELQEDVQRKSEEYAALDARCRARISAMEERLNADEQTIRELRQKAN